MESKAKLTVPDTIRAEINSYVNAYGIDGLAECLRNISLAKAKLWEGSASPAEKRAAKLWLSSARGAERYLADLLDHGPGSGCR